MQAEIRICMISRLAASERAEQPRAIQRAVKGTAEVVRLDRTFASGFGANQPTNPLDSENFPGRASARAKIMHAEGRNCHIS